MNGLPKLAGLAARKAKKSALVKLDELVVDTLVEWKDDPRAARMTVRNLLDLSSGLEPESELLGRLGDVGVGEWRARKETRREVPAR